MYNLQPDLLTTSQWSYRQAHSYRDSSNEGRRCACTGVPHTILCGSSSSLALTGPAPEPDPSPEPKTILPSLLLPRISPVLAICLTEVPVPCRCWPCSCSAEYPTAPAPAPSPAPAGTDVPLPMVPMVPAVPALRLPLPSLALFRARSRIVAMYLANPPAEPAEDAEGCRGVEDVADWLASSMALLFAMSSIACEGASCGGTGGALKSFRHNGQEPDTCSSLRVSYLHSEGRLTVQRSNLESSKVGDLRTSNCGCFVVPWWQHPMRHTLRAIPPCGPTIATEKNVPRINTALMIHMFPLTWQHPQIISLLKLQQTDRTRIRILILFYIRLRRRVHTDSLHTGHRHERPRRCMDIRQPILARCWPGPTVQRCSTRCRGRSDT